MLCFTEIQKGQLYPSGLVFAYDHKAEILVSYKMEYVNIWLILKSVYYISKWKCKFKYVM